MNSSKRFSIEDFEALQKEWDIQDNSTMREREIIRNKFLHNTPKNDSHPDKKLTPREWLKELEGTLLDDPVQRDVDTRNGPATVANFRLNTKYGTIKVSLWNNQAEKVMKYVSRDRIILTNIQVKDPFDDLQQVSGSRNTIIKESSN